MWGTKWNRRRGCENRPPLTNLADGDLILSDPMQPGRATCARIEESKAELNLGRDELKRLEATLARNASGETKLKSTL